MFIDKGAHLEMKLIGGSSLGAVRRETVPRQQNKEGRSLFQFYLISVNFLEEVVF